MTGGQVRDNRGNEEGTDPARSFFQQRLMRFLQGGDSAHAGADKDTNATSFNILYRELGVTHRHNGAGQGVVDKPVHLLDLFLLHIEKRVKSLDLCSDLRIVAASVESSDVVDP